MSRRMTPKARPRLVMWWTQYALPQVWYVSPPGEILLYATPDACIEAMRTAAKPSVQRLHLSSIFAGGRRYHLDPVTQGFQMTTTNKVFWHPRRRTRPSAVLEGVFVPLEAGTLRLELDIRMRVMYLVDAFLLPLFMTSLLLFIPWPRVIVVAAVVALFVLSWLGHRYNAMLEADAMLWFIRKALAEFANVQTPVLPAQTGDLLYDEQVFEAALRRFYR